MCCKLYANFKISYRSTCGSFILVLQQHCLELDLFASFQQCLLRVSDHKVWLHPTSSSTLIGPSSRIQDYRATLKSSHLLQILYKRRLSSLHKGSSTKEFKFLFADKVVVFPWQISPKFRFQASGLTIIELVDRFFFHLQSSSDFLHYSDTMSDIKAIQELSSVDSVKNKHAYRRGQVTKLKHQIEELLNQPLRDGKTREFQDLKQELSREIELHSALQLQLESLLRTKVGEDDAYAEECTGEEVTKQHRSIMKQVHYLIDRHQHYKVATTLQEELEKLDSITNITTRAFEKSFSKFSDNVAIFVQETEDFIDDEQISPICQLLKASVARLLKHITESQAAEKNSDRDHPTSVMHALGTNQIQSRATILLRKAD